MLSTTSNNGLCISRYNLFQQNLVNNLLIRNISRLQKNLVVNTSDTFLL